LSVTGHQPPTPPSHDDYEQLDTSAAEADIIKNNKKVTAGINLTAQNDAFNFIIFAFTFTVEAKVSNLLMSLVTSARLTSPADSWVAVGNWGYTAVNSNEIHQVKYYRA